MIKNTRFESCFYHSPAMWVGQIAYSLCVLGLLNADTGWIHLIELLRAVNNMIQEKHLKQFSTLREHVTIFRYPYKLLSLPRPLYFLSSLSLFIWQTLMDYLCGTTELLRKTSEMWEQGNCCQGIQLLAVATSDWRNPAQPSGSSEGEIYCHWCVFSSPVQVAIPSFNQCLLSTYYVQCTVFSAKDNKNKGESDMDFNTKQQNLIQKTRKQINDGGQRIHAMAAKILLGRSSFKQLVQQSFNIYWTQSTLCDTI